MKLCETQLIAEEDYKFTRTHTFTVDNGDCIVYNQASRYGPVTIATEIVFPSKQLSSVDFMSTGISCVFLNTCDKLQSTIMDTYLTFARAVYTFNANVNQ